MVLYERVLVFSCFFFPRSTVPQGSSREPECPAALSAGCDKRAAHVEPTVPAAGAFSRSSPPHIATALRKGGRPPGALVPRIRRYGRLKRRHWQPSVGPVLHPRFLSRVVSILSPLPPPKPSSTHTRYLIGTLSECAGDLACILSVWSLPVRRCQTRSLPVRGRPSSLSLRVLGRDIRLRS